MTAVPGRTNPAQSCCVNALLLQNMLDTQTIKSLLA